MAKGDRRSGGGKALSDRTMDSLREGRDSGVAVIVERQQQSATVEVGDFLSDLATAFCYRERTGQTEGEWLADPERAYTDGYAFGTEVKKASGQKLQIALAIDGSESMWTTGVMGKVGPVFTRIDKLVRMAVRDLPEGSLSYAAFAFNDRGMLLPPEFVEKYQSVTAARKTASGKHAKNATVYSMYTETHPKQDEVRKLVESGALPAKVYRCEYDRQNSVQKNYIDSKTKKKEQRIDKLTFKEDVVDTVAQSWRAFRFRSDQTLLTPLFKTIQEWERDNDPDALRLDIILTDGNLEPADVEQASRVQHDRDGRLRTIMLNFQERSHWSGEQMPDRCVQYAVTGDTVANEIRNAIDDALRDLL